MSLLTDHAWKPKYSQGDGNLVRLFYVPALETAVRYCDQRATSEPRRLHLRPVA